MPQESPAPVPECAAGRPDGARILLVVPTLGRRPAFLRTTLESVRSQSEPCDVLMVVPRDAAEAREIGREFGAELMDDPGGQSRAINLGIEARASGHDYVNWLGDDDTLRPDALRRVAGALDARPDASGAFGYCQYVDQDDNPLWVSRFGRIAKLVVPWGPNLVPQPGMLVRTAAWQEVGGLDDSLRYTMDLDLLLRLRRVGPLIPVGSVVSTFRWHTTSLTVADRTASLAEAEEVKRRYYSPLVRRLAPLWEQPVRIATVRAARRVGRSAKAVEPGS